MRKAVSLLSETGVRNARGDLIRPLSSQQNKRYKDRLSFTTKTRRINVWGLPWFLILGEPLQRTGCTETSCASVLHVVDAIAAIIPLLHSCHLTRVTIRKRPEVQVCAVNVREPLMLFCQRFQTLRRIKRRRSDCPQPVLQIRCDNRKHVHGAPEERGHPFQFVRLVLVPSRGRRGR